LLIINTRYSNPNDIDKEIVHVCKADNQILIRNLEMCGPRSGFTDYHYDNA